MPEAANVEVRFRASREVMNRLSDWSKPVQIRIVSWAPDEWELEIRDPFEPVTTSGTVAEAVRRAERATNGSIAMMIEAGIQAAMAQRETAPDNAGYVAPVDPLRYARSIRQHTDACMEREDGLCDCGAYTGAPLRTVPPRMAMGGDL